MKQYHEALKYVLENGEQSDDRTGIGTISIFGYQMRFNLQEGFPAVTTKRLAWKAVVGELLWFLEGNTDERRLAEITYGKPREELIDKTTIWTANANAQGVELGYTNNELVKELGPVYGHQWRSFNKAIQGRSGSIYGVDQVKWLIKEIKTNPLSRRLILSAWNPSQLDQMALPPCHTLVQFRVQNNKLSCQLYQRSSDMFLGVPFNIASYSLLTHILAQICNLTPGEFVWTGGDCHIYNNHIEQVKEQISRKPLTLPNIIIPEFSSIEEVLTTAVTDYRLENYNPMPSIKAAMAV
jgi:thymidylate synthase